MISAVTQRWRDRRGSTRAAGETIDPKAYDVSPLGELPAKAFVAQHHYSASYPAARFRFGLHLAGALVGVAVFSHPANDLALRELPGAPIESVELGRFVLLDSVPGNGETWFLARCFEALRRERLTGIVSFSDPFARRDAAGALVHGGHVGTIYQAHNAIYLGQASANTLRLLPDGSVLSKRAISKLRQREQGWRYVVAQLEAHGAEPLGDGDLDSWWRRWVPAVSRTARHPGNHKYAWGLSKSAKRHLPASKAFPKLIRLETGEREDGTRSWWVCS